MARSPGKTENKTPTSELVAPPAGLPRKRGRSDGTATPKPRASEVNVGGRTLKLSNLDKVLYPQAAFTKAQVIDYYHRIAPALLPHLAGRPLTLKRYPDGVDGESFYEKNCPKFRPDWFHTVAVQSDAREREINYCVVDDLASLIWVANLASLELHASLSLAKDLQRSTALAFDLDPGLPADALTCARVALLIREMLEHFGLQGFVKTSGSKGLQLYVPLNGGGATYEETKGFAHAMARLLEERHPKLITSEMKKELRPGKVFIDWSQNDRHKTTVSVYSLRARERPTVSTPMRWEEVEAAVKSQKLSTLVFEAPAVIARAERFGDLFGPVATLKQKLPSFPAGGA
jgi:bifunctional non-homologous end joining protein LigD